MTAPHPPPETDATPLARKLAARIAACGPMTVHDYMEACLYDPDHGYYRKTAGVGLGGDFITAPEISQVFGELIGLWCGEVWRQMGEPAAVRLVELGPGRGTLMADALRALRVLPRFLERVTLHLVESSAALGDAQKAALASAPVPVSWHEDFRTVPAGPAIVIANEFFDCLPVRQLAFDAASGTWLERAIALDGDAFRLVLQPPQEPFDDALGADPIEDGAILERRPQAGELLHSFKKRAPIAALIIDYGYSRPSFGDTVQAVRQHRFAGIFDAPGESDLTAHVDFCVLSQAAADAGLKAFGPMSMGEWLLRLGLEARAAKLLAHATESEAAELRTGLARLVDPAQMGALFKVMALTDGIAAPPPPFVERFS